jgi:rSAM/selenodomain-associated transferase 1
MKPIESTALIIFVRNPIHGKVKTRLAKEIGDARALEIYKLLLMHTFNVTQALACRKYVFYVDKITKNDLWKGADFAKRIQKGIDLGARMHNAMNELFEEGFAKVIIIGSDSFEVSTSILEEAISQLAHHDAVLGPACDGGYYLLGLNTLIPELFVNKIWSTDQVSKDTIHDFIKMNKSYYLLSELNDIDDASDLKFFDKEQ